MRLVTRFFGVYFFVLVLGCEVFGSQTPWQTSAASKTQTRIISHIDTVTKDTNEIIFALEFKIPESWHIYWKNARDVGLPPHLEIQSLPSAWDTSGLLFPAPKIIPTSAGQSFSYGYEKNTLIPFVLKKNKPEKNSGSEFQFSGAISYLICNLQCIPESREFTISLPVKDIEKVSQENIQIQKALSTLPQQTSLVTEEWKSPNELHLSFPKDWDLIENIFIARGEKPERKSLKANAEKISDTRWKITIPEQLASIEWTAVSTKGSWKNISKFEAVSTLEKEALSDSLATGKFWLALLFAFIGGLILNLMPCVLPVLLLKTASILKMSHSRKVMHASLLPTVYGILTSFILLAGFTFALQKLGHSIGWGFQFQSPIFLGFLILVIFIFALNLFGIFNISLSSKTSTALASTKGAFAEGVLATLLATPCSAPFLGTALTYALTQSGIILFILFFMMGLGLASPYFLLLVHPKFLNLLPKPGLWMEGLKRFLAYSLLLTGIWIFSVFQQITSFAMVIVLLNLLVFTFILFREFKAPLATLVLACIFSITAIFFPWQKNARPDQHDFSTVSQVEEQIAAGRKIFVVVTADWCLTCKFNEQTVIHTEWFQKDLKARDIELMVIDWTQKDDNVSKFLSRHGRVAIPFSAILSNQKQILLPELLTHSIVKDALSQF